MAYPNRWLPLAALVAVTTAAAHAQDAASVRPYAATWERITAAEDARAATAAQLATLVDGTRSDAAVIRVIAVRALGRLERADLLDRIVPLLRDSDPAVRAAAAHAVGQALSRGDGMAGAAVVDAALETEAHNDARAAMAETLGRLPYGTTEAATAAANRLAQLLAQETAPEARLGILRGLHFLARQQTGRTAVAIHADVLRNGLAESMGADDVRRRTRRLAIATLAAAGAATPRLIEAALDDDDAFVRREAVVALNATTFDAREAERLLGRALTDATGAVRYEALRIHARRFPAASCEHVMARVQDDDAHVRLVAIDQLRATCPDHAAATRALIERAGAAVAGDAWHESVRAFAALAVREPAAAQPLLARYATHSSPFVRAHAANAAGALPDTAVLLVLAGDPHPNVRSAAVQALRRVAGRSADSVYLAQLAQDDSQLIMAAVAALDSTADPRTGTAMLNALDRITALHRETSRDGRVALLNGVRRHGDAALRPRLEPYRADFDPRIAGLAADIIGEWTGTRPEPQPSRPPALPPPTFAESEALEAVSFVLEMEDGSAIVVRLLPFVAPTNAARFARLARNGYFDGLTFHRVVPNFVIQGGSPGANEYAGDGHFTRDELGASNWRGTVGLSTRGRDTGDAQVYINTVDNVRLDHDYTIFGVVTAGMQVVDRLQEGARIVRVTERR